MKFLAILLGIILGIAASELLLRLPFLSSLRKEIVVTQALRQRIGENASIEPFAEEFGDDKKFQAALRQNHLTPAELKRSASLTIDGDKWIEGQLLIAPREDEIAAYFQQHPNEFVLPLRLRARHIFFAAPAGSPPEIEEGKRQAANGLLAQLKAGKDFAQLAATWSEDDATKNIGGDLGFFAANRVPPEFFSAAAKLLTNGEVSLVRSHLGFHALQVLEILPTRAMTLAEAHDGIRTRLAGIQRGIAVAALARQLAAKK